MEDRDSEDPDDEESEPAHSGMGRASFPVHMEMGEEEISSEEDNYDPHIENKIHRIRQGFGSGEDQRIAEVEQQNWRDQHQPGEQVSIESV